ncbi:hypothetical protein KBD45_03615 [Candidatus Dojkabacteria bacterium]|nr:hypothetical protein [Candidatus Dojkabacteria bacterium]
MDIKNEKITEYISIGSPIKKGYRPLIEFPMVFFVSLTGDGATSTIEKMENKYSKLLILPSRRYFTDKVTIPWSLLKQGKEIKNVENRKLRYEFSKYFRKFNPEGFVGILRQLSINPECENIDYVLYDSLRHVRELVYTNRYFNKPLYVLFKTKLVDRVKRISNQNYSFSDIGKSESYNSIFHIPGWNSTFTQKQMDEIDSLIKLNEINIEGASKAIQIIIKEHQEYDHDRLTMKLFDIAHDRTFLVDSSELNPEERAVEIYNWIISKLEDKNEKN